jgi:pimeloyl-ACP methyl ester carboxylesterase
MIVTALQLACGLRQLSEDIDIMRHTALVTGRVRGASPERGLIYVADFVDAGREKKRMGSEELPPRVTEYGFLVDTKYRHDVAAFQDTNGDRRWEPGEPVGLLPNGFDVDARDERTLPDIVLIESASAPDGFDLDLRAEVFREALPVSRGEVTTLANPMFAPDIAAKGMWEPITAAKEAKLGIYLLEEYDPHRTPVVFVHGVNGTPRDFKDLIGALDTQRYQAWVMFYPSGFRLGRVAHGLALGLQALRDRLHVPRVVIAAHSMGGLVARGAVLDLAREGQADFVQALITFSTPYGGDERARFGANLAAQAVESLIDMPPGSEFLESLRTPLPKSVAFYLFFSVGGRPRLDIANNDGSVFVSSELAQWAQDDATRTFGYNVSHAEIRSNPAVLTRFAAILSALPESPSGEPK